MIRFDHVSKVYPGNPRPALSSVDLEILRGEFVFLVGASGSGKSSFLRLVLKEDRPTNGTIHVLGQQLNQLSSRKVPYYRRSLGVVFQDFRLLPNKSVFDNVAFTLQVIGKSRGFIQEAVPDVLAMVGLQGKEQRLPHELSGGEQQRVAIARAVVNKPAVLLADEPTGNLDPLTSAGIMQVLERINANGTTVIMATHDSGIVDQMQKRVIELIGGEVVRDEVGGQYQTSAIDLPRTAENPVGVNPEHPPVAAPTPVFVPAAPLPAPVRPTAPAEPANAAERREQARRDKQRRADEKARAKEEATREAAAAKASRKPAKGADAPAAVAAPASATPSAAPSAAPASPRRASAAKPDQPPAVAAVGALVGEVVEDRLRERQPAAALAEVVGHGHAREVDDGGLAVVLEQRDDAVVLADHGHGERHGIPRALPHRDAVLDHVAGDLHHGRLEQHPLGVAHVERLVPHGGDHGVHRGEALLHRGQRDVGPHRRRVVRHALIGHGTRPRATRAP